MVRQNGCHIEINKTLLPLKVYYFFFFSATGTLLPFIPIYMKRLGLLAQEAGIIFGCMPFISFFVQPLFSFVADRFHKHKLILLLCTFMSGLSYMCLLFVPAKHIPHTITIKTNVHCNTQDSYIRDCLPFQANKSGGSKITFSRDDECPLTFYEYASMSRQNNMTGIHCKASCLFAVPGAYTSRVCFTTDVRPFGERNCVDIWVSSSKESYLHFAIKNATVTMMSEIHQERIALPHLICKEYNLKNLLHQGKSYWQMLCDEETVLNCDFECPRQTNTGCEKRINLYGITFVMFFIFLLICNLFSSPTTSLIDAIAYDLLGEQNYFWGRQRMWGTIGFGLFALLSTGLMEFLEHSHKDIDYHISFYLFIAFITLACIAGSRMESSTTIKSAQMFQKLGLVFKNIEILIFLFVILIFGTLNGAITGFLFWFLKDKGTSQTVLGLCLFLNCLSELIILGISNKILKKIGHIPCLYMALAAYSIRFLCYSFLTKGWFVLAIEPLHGLTFGLMYASASGHANILAPPGLSATMQGIVGGLHFGFGKGIGSMLTGSLFTVMGAVWTWRVYSVSALIIMLLYIPTQCLFSKRRQRLEVPEQVSKFESLEEDVTNESPIERLLTEDNQSPETEIKGGKLAWSRDEL